MIQIDSKNFKKVFFDFNNALNALFHGNTLKLEGGRIIEPMNKKKKEYLFFKDIESNNGVKVNITIEFNGINEDYNYYQYNFIFGENKLLFHYEPEHMEGDHPQPHINVYINKEELKNHHGEGIHIISHKIHPEEILIMVKRYFSSAIPQTVI